MKEQSLNPSDIAVKSLNLTYIEEIKRLMLDIFSGEPWNDHWSGDQLHAYITQLTGNANSLAYGLYVDGQLAGIALGRIINGMREQNTGLMSLESIPAYSRQGWDQSL